VDVAKLQVHEKLPTLGVVQYFQQQSTKQAQDDVQREKRILRSFMNQGPVCEHPKNDHTQKLT
jgi:hypothetical protein